jgi:hypothetical protein
MKNMNCFIDTQTFASNPRKSNQRKKKFAFLSIIPPVTLLRRQLQN